MTNAELLQEVLRKYRSHRRGGWKVNFNDPLGGSDPHADVFRIGVDTDTGEVICAYIADTGCWYPWLNEIVRFGYDGLPEREISEAARDYTMTDNEKREQLDELANRQLENEGAK